VIRNVVVGRVRPGTDLARVQEALDAIVALPVEGLLDVRVGLDAGLRPGAWSFAITSDFVDAEAYRVYDAEAEHNRIRREQFDPGLRGDRAGAVRGLSGLSRAARPAASRRTASRPALRRPRAGPRTR
jgi:hypothetical protein